MDRLIRKYWWILLVLPFFINVIFLINANKERWLRIDISLSEQTMDWLIMWATYLSSIATAIMAYLTYRIIKQNNDLRKGELLFRIIEQKSSWFLEISNIGNGVVQDIKISFNDNFLDLLYGPVKEELNKNLSIHYCLKPTEIAQIRIDSSYKVARGSAEVNDKGFYDKISDGYTDDELAMIKRTPIVITGTYKTFGQIEVIKESITINNSVHIKL